MLYQCIGVTRNKFQLISFGYLNELQMEFNPSSMKFSVVKIQNCPIEVGGGSLNHFQLRMLCLFKNFSLNQSSRLIQKPILKIHDG